MKSNNITEKYICHECVGESYLKSAIKDSGRKKNAHTAAINTKAFRW